MGQYWQWICPEAGETFSTANVTALRFGSRFAAAALPERCSFSAASRISANADSSSSSKRSDRMPAASILVSTGSGE